MNMLEWNKKQIDEMLSADNKYYFWLKHGRPHNSLDELAIFYAENGGASGFAERNRKPHKVKDPE
jgi:hypothetical protein